MDKSALMQRIIAHLAGELALAARTARATQAEAAHEQNKAENKYDTRGLEASYLAHGQARQADETEQALRQCRALAVRAFAAADPIALGALVALEGRAGGLICFIAPGAGGVEFSHEKKTVLVLTPSSPLGRQLMGRRQGERLTRAIGRTRREYAIAGVS